MMNLAVEAGVARLEEPPQDEADRTLVEVLRRRAATEGARVAYTFLADGEEDERPLTYAGLEARARRIAVALAERGTPGARAVLVYPPGLEFIAGLFGCFFAGVVAVPVYPPDLRDVEGGLERLQRVAADAGATIVLTTDAYWAWLGPRVERAPALRQLEWFATDALEVGTEDAWRRPIIDGGHVALLQYTSGSTEIPRGVMVTHANILTHGRNLAAVLALSARSVAVGWLPLYHDMGLVGTVLIPMQFGCTAIHLPPLAFLERPHRWLRAMSRYGGTLSPAPNFAYELCVRRVAPEERRGLDLSSWVAAMNGAEPVRADTCERFIAAFEPHGFRREAMIPCYGLAEATLMVAGGPLATAPRVRLLDAAALERHRVAEATADAAGIRTIVGCGAIVPDHEVVIVDPETRRIAHTDEVGEVWVAGPCVAAGYWGRDAETTATFGGRLAGGDGGPFLRTGDLGFIRQGTLYVTGRHKDLIVVRGRNHYPQDLEQTAEHAHPALRPGGGAAFSVEEGGEERVVVVHEVETRGLTSLDEVTSAIRAAVAARHQLHVHAVCLIPPRTLPKTSSGKVRRRACRTAFVAGTLPMIGGSADERVDGATASAELGQWIVEQIAELRDVPASDVRQDEVFIALGIDSAETALLTAALEERVGRPISMQLFLEYPTIAQLAQALVAGRS